MGLVSLAVITNGTLADASVVMGNFDGLAAVINGQLDQSNLAANAVGTTQLAADAVTSAKIANGTIATADLAQDRLIVPSGAVVGGTLALSTPRTPNALRPTMVTVTACLSTSGGGGSATVEARVGSGVPNVPAGSATFASPVAGGGAFIPITFIVPAGFAYGGYPIGSSGFIVIAAMAIFEVAL